MWSTREGNGKPLQYSCLENLVNNMKRQKDRPLRDELPGLVGAQYATGEEWRNNSRKNEEAGGGAGLVAQPCLTLVAPWTVARQAPLSVGFSRQEYWSGLPFPSPGNLPDPGIEPRSPALQADSLLTELQGKPMKRLSQSEHNTQL